MFEQHSQLFGLLVTMERMRMSQQLSNQELGLFVNGVDTLEMEHSIEFDDKPDWLTNKVCSHNVLTQVRLFWVSEAIASFKPLK